MKNAVEAGALRRTVGRQRVAIGVLAVGLAVVAGAGLGRGGAMETPQYTAGGDRLYRVWDDGRVEYLIVDFANGSVKGIPGWASVHIDDSWTRDRMGNAVRR